MSRYRKKPVVVEAERWDGDCETARRLSVWTKGAVDYHHETTGSLYIKTLEGVMVALPGDMIIRGVAGEFYPCKPDVFKATYEPA